MLPRLFRLLLGIPKRHHDTGEESITMKDTGEECLEDLRNLKGDAPDDTLNDTDVINNKQPNQDVIDNKQPNQDVINNKQPYQDVIHDKQPNQDVINNKQPNQSNKKPFRKIKSKKRPDQDAEGLNIKTRKLLYLLEILLMDLARLSFTVGTPRVLLLLVLTSPVAGSSDTHHQSSLPLQSSCDLPDRRICFLPTNTTVSEVDKKDVQLVWKYNSREPVEEILITRSEETVQQGENVASWTINGGSKTNRVLSTDVNLQHRTEGDVGIIILTLIKAYPIDFDKHYLCQVSIQKRTYSNRKQLKAIKVDYRPVTEVVEGRPGEDVELVWRYKYPRPVKVLIFENDILNKEDMMTWTNVFEEVEDEYKNRLRLNIKSKRDQVEITLTLLDTTTDDYNHIYYSRVVAEGGYSVLAHLFLSERSNKANQIEKKLVVDRKEQSSSSTASGVFTSNLWMILFFLSIVQFLQSFNDVNWYTNLVFRFADENLSK